MHDVPYGYCRCGCGLPTRTATRNRRELGHCKGEPMPYVNGHNPRGKRSVTWRVEDRGHDTPCWTWLGYVADNGYGKMAKSSQRGMGYAHRLVFTEMVGPIPDGLDLDHLCRNRDCVNPAHLEPVSRSENLRRGYAARKES